MKVNLNWQGKLKFEATRLTTVNTVTRDAKEGAGGDASAPSPMEMVLHGAAGCMAIDIGVILRHRMDKVTKLAIEADGERADTEPKYYKQIKMNIIIDGDIPANRHSVQLTCRKKNTAPLYTHPLPMSMFKTSSTAKHSNLLSEVTLSIE